MEFFERDAIDYVVEGHSLRDITNYNEYLVLELMREVYSQDGSRCRCPLCMEDVFALSLNALPPRYIQSTSLDLYKESRHFVDEDRVRDAVLTAVKKVAEHPNHGPA